MHTYKLGALQLRLWLNILITFNWWKKKSALLKKSQHFISVSCYAPNNIERCSVQKFLAQQSSKRTRWHSQCGKCFGNAGLTTNNMKDTDEMVNLRLKKTTIQWKCVQENWCVQIMLQRVCISLKQFSSKYWTCSWRQHAPLKFT